MRASNSLKASFCIVFFIYSCQLARPGLEKDKWLNSDRSKSGSHIDRQNSGQLGIVNGKDEPHLNDSVFLIQMDFTDQKEKIRKSNIGTGFAAIRRERCIVTARHVITLEDQNPPDKTLTVWRGIEPLSDPEKSERSIASLHTYRGYEAGQFQDTDIGVIWMPAYKRPREISTYTPLPIDPTEQITANSPRREPDYLLSSKNPRFDAVGYGFSSANRFEGAGRRRRGTFDLLQYLNHDRQGDNANGGHLVGYRDNKSPFCPYHSLCQGDSGGPWLTKKEFVFGVTSATYNLGGNCDQKTDGIGVALDRYDPHPKNPDEAKNNYDHLLFMADSVCTKRIKVLLGNNSNISSVRGVTKRDPEYDLEKIPLNGWIACKGEPSLNLYDQSGKEIPSDCSEYINENMTLTMAATPKENYVFSHWGSETSVDDVGNTNHTAKCPCDGSTSPSCTVTYENIGLYTDNHSIDTAICIPFAVPRAGDGGGLKIDAPSPM